MRIILAAFLILFLTFDGTAEEVYTQYGVKLTFEGDNPDFSDVREYLRMADRITARLAAQKEPARREVNCQIFLVSRNIPGNIEFVPGKKFPAIYLPGEFGKWKNDPLALRRLMSLLLLIKSGVVPENLDVVDRVPCWLATGVVEQCVLKRQLNVTAGRNYFELRAIECVGGGLSLDDLIMGNYSPIDGIFYDLFAMGSEYLLSQCLAVASSQDDFFRVMVVDSYTQKSPPVDIFFDTAGKRLYNKLSRRIVHDKNLSERESVRVWFRNGLRSRNINFFYPQATEILYNQFLDLRTQQLEIKTSDGKTVPAVCRLDELGLKVRQTIDPERKIEEVRRAVLQLQSECPGEMLPPLMRIYNELDIFYRAILDATPDAKGTKKKDRTPEEWSELAESFRNNVKEAMGELETACRRRIEVENYVLRQEKLLVPQEILYHYRLKCLDDLDRANREIWPDVNNYLDGLEKEYIRE